MKGQLMKLKKVRKILIILLLCNPSLFFGWVVPLAHILRQALPKIIEATSKAASSIISYRTVEQMKSYRLTPPPNFSPAPNPILNIVKNAAQHMVKAAPAIPIVNAPKIAQAVNQTTTNPALRNFIADKMKTMVQRAALVKAAQNKLMIPAATQAIASIAQNSAPVVKQVTLPLIQSAAVASQSSRTTKVSFVPSPPVQTSAAMGKNIQQTLKQVPSSFSKNAFTAALHNKADVKKVQIPQQNPINIPANVSKATSIPKTVSFLRDPAVQQMQAQLQSINDAYANRVFFENQRIYNNPTLSLQHQVIKGLTRERLTAACNFSANPEIIKTQLTLLNNVLSHQTENEDLQYAVVRMIERLCNENGEFIGCFSSDQVENLQHHASYKRGFRHFCKNVFRDIKGVFGYKSEIVEKFLKHPYNTNLYNLCHYLDKKEAATAQHFLDLIKPNHPLDNCTKCKIYQCMASSFQELYKSIFNEHDIEHSYEKDIIWPNFKKILDTKGADYVQQKNQIHLLLQQRKTILEYLISKFPVKNIPSCLENTLYNIVSMYESQDKTLDYLAEFSSDHTDPIKQEIFNYIFGKEILPKIYDFPHINTFKDIVIPSSITTKAFTPLRTLYFKYMTLDPKTENEISLIRQGLKYIQEACSPTKDAAIHQYLAHTTFDALTKDNVDKTILSCSDFTQNFKDPIAQQIKERLFPILVSALSDSSLPTQNANELMDLQRSYAPGLIECIDKIHQHLLKNDITAALDIEKNLLPHFNRNFSAEKLAQLNNPKPDIHPITEVASNAIAFYAQDKLSSFTTDFQNLNAKCSALDQKKHQSESQRDGCIAINPQFKDKPGCHLPENKEMPVICNAPKIKTEAERREELQAKEMQDNQQKAKNKPSKGCNWSDGANLPSFKKEQFTDTKIRPIPKQPDKLDQEKIELIKLQKQLSEIKELKASEKEAIDNFIVQLTLLVKKYGKEALEAARVYNINHYKAQRKECTQAIEKLAILLKEINADPKTELFKYDSAHNNKATPGSVDEAIAGKACIEQGILSELIRSSERKEDFIEPLTNKVWDVKTASSFSLEGIYIFNVNKFLSSLKVEYMKTSEHIILQITNLNQNDRQILFKSLKQELAREELQRTVVVDAYNKAESKTQQQLINFLGK